MGKRKLTKNELAKEARYSSCLSELMWDMSPHQLELLTTQAIKILNGDPVDK